MLRGAIILALLAVAAAMTLPFLISSLSIDQRGVIIPGRVSFKREDVVVHNSTLNRVAEATIEYSKPDGSGVGFLGVRLGSRDYDALRLGQAVELHYLRSEDLPDLPLVHGLRRAQLLPTVRLANQRAGAGLRLVFTDKVAAAMGAAALCIVFLLLWKVLRIPGLSWAVAFFVLLALAATYVNDFPRPMPAPSAGLRQGTGQVKSVERITRLFGGSRRRGMVADQPMEAVGVSFVPDGRKEPVLAIDLIDAGSVTGLREKSSVLLSYESASPRTAYIQGATRHFAARNFSGAGVQAIASLAAVIVILGGVQLLGWFYRRATRRT